MPTVHYGFHLANMLFIYFQNIFGKNVDCLEQMPLKFVNVPVRTFVTVSSSDMPLGYVSSSDYSVVADGLVQ